MSADVDEYDFDESYIDAACGELGKFFDEERDGVFFERQLQVRYERRFFHWVTSQALQRLVADGGICSELYTFEHYDLP